MKVLKELRRSKKMTQDKLSEILGVSRSTISMWEINASEPDSETISRIAGVFKVTTDYLLGRTNDPSPPDAKKDIADEDIKFALFGGSADITDAQFEEVKRYARYIREREAGDK